MGNFAGHSPACDFAQRSASDHLSGDRASLDSLSKRAGPLLSSRGAIRIRLPAELSRPHAHLLTLGHLASPSLRRESRRYPGGVAARTEFPSPPPPSSGFALVGVIALVPLLVALVVAAAGFYMMTKKKLTAQALCIRAATLLQQKLGQDLADLLRLNPQARRLEQRRIAAERSLKAAVQNANPILIKISLAALLAVKTEQAALRTRQEAIFQKASQRRVATNREFKRETIPLGATDLEARRYFHRALAVIPTWPGSIAPEYRLAPSFTSAQQHRLQFSVELAPAFLGRSFQQTTVCSVSLQRKEGKWREKIITASP